MYKIKKLYNYTILKIKKLYNFTYVYT